ncbi:hypothetical protein EMCG_07239 [[Emmonsia] crescens]|uniref:NACHT domain-containing protein n=1 Tax=[Emmonsia] crescens TaxID=73230 RepID=A0A0G2I967_9EURO|nr:hypothetical protein EMCG_07239 [Emmonsia crescens UAMH 3008]
MPTGDLLERFLQDICETDPENEKLRIEDDKGGLLKDCFTWILQEPQFLKWQSNQNERLLWIRGEPGKGKTMLMIGLIDVFTTQLNGSDSLSYFFLQNSAPHLNNGVSVLRGLIWKLLFAHPQLHRYIPDEYRSKNKDMGMDMFRRPDAFSTLKKMLSCMLRDPSLETVYIFVDALDECDHDLNKLVQWIASDTSEPLSKAKWLLSSRRIPIIQETFLSEDQQHAILELPETHISQAVRRFIQLNVKRLAKMKSYDDELRRNVEASLAKGAESTFLWVYLVCNSLETIPRRRTLSELKKFPSGLTPLYDRMLQQIERQDEDDRELCKQILRAVTICYRPLSLEELSSLAGLHDAAVDDSRDLADLCGSLLILRDQSIYLVHHTAKEYLVAALYVEDHSVILSRSLYAMSNILQKNIYNLRGAGTSIDRIKLTGPDPLAPVRYACFYWIDHLCQIDRNLDSQVGLCDGGDIDLFLRENILYWLEALSLMKGMSNAVAMIKKLQNALSVTLSTTQTPGLETFVYDAERFVLTNMSIVERAPLQLYSSALIFSPTVSIIRDKFWAHLPSWVDHVPAVENIWSAFLQVLEHPDCVTAIAFLNGRLVTSTLFDPVVRVWNPSTGALVWKFEFDTWWLLAAFSPENTIASVYYIGTLIRIRDISTGALKRVIYTHYKVSVLSFSLDGKILAAGCVNGSIEIWNPSSGSRKMVLHGHTEFIRAISFSPGSGFLASAADDWTVRVWDISSGSSVQVLKHQYCPSAVAFSPDSKYIASGTMGGCIRIWDSSTRELLSVCKGHSGIVTAVVFSPTNSEIIASGSYDKTVRLWDISTGSTGSLVDTFTGHGDIVRVVSFSPDGMLASGSSDRTVRLWDIERMPIPTVAQEWDFHIIDEMVFSPDGKLVASRSGTKKVRLWNTYGECVGRLDSLDSGTFQFSPDGKRIAVIPSQGRNSIQLFDIEEDTTTQLLERPSLVFSALAFSPDGKSLAYDASSCFLHVHYCTINLWNLSTGECTCVVERQPLRISVLAFSPNGDILASGSRDGSNRAVISLWNLQTGEAIKCVATTHPTRWMSFANDGQSLETDQGVIEVESVSSSGIQHGPLRPPNLSVCGDWVAWKGECRLWLPSDYRPVCWVAKGNKLALALHTGRVVCLGLRESDK